MQELMFKPAGELAALVRGGDVSARDLVSASLARIEALDPTLNAFVQVDAERALAAADSVAPNDSRPFAGVPIAVKSNVAVSGLEQSMGSRFLASNRPQHTAYLVRRLRDAGCIVVGVTTMPEFGILPTTEPLHTGATRNPWNPGHTPGGSSGGSAAAVASGMVALAHGNDGGGSIRIPAACTNLVGLKPSRGRVSRGPEMGDSFLAVDGGLTRTVAETAQLLDIMAGYEVGDATWAPRASEPYSLAMRRAPGRLRVAVTDQNPLDAEVHPDCRRAMAETADLLAQLGHDVSEATPALPDIEGFRLFARVFGPMVSLGVAYGEVLAGRPPEEDEIEPLTRAIFERASNQSSIAFLAALTQLQALARGIVAFFADYDLLLTPALAGRPPAIGELHGHGEDPLEDFARSGRLTPYTAVFNFTGQPAISVPAGFGEDGLPSAVQLVSKPLGEDTLLQVAAQLESARPWGGRRPELSAG
jgi:amidase